MLCLRNYLKGGGSVGVTGRSLGSGAACGGAIAGGELSDGEAIVFGTGSSVRRSEGENNTSLGKALLPAIAEGAGAPVTPGGRVSSGAVPVRPVLDEAPSVAEDGDENDREVEDEAGCELDPSASAVGTNASAAGDQT